MGGFSKFLEMLAAEAGKKQAKARTAVDVAKELGGIRPSGETRAAELHKRPGVVSKKGASLNQLRESMVERGMLPEDATDDDALQMVIEAHSGRAGVTDQADVGAVLDEGERAGLEEQLRVLEEAADDLRDAAAEADLEFDADDFAAMAEIVAKGEGEPEDVIWQYAEREAMTSYEDAAREGATEYNIPDDEIPFETGALRDGTGQIEGEGRLGADIGGPAPFPGDEGAGVARAEGPEGSGDLFPEEAAAARAADEISHAQSFPGDPAPPPSPRLNKAALRRDIEGADLEGIAQGRAPEGELDLGPPAPEGLLFNPTRIQEPDDINVLFDDVARAFPKRFKEHTRGVQKLDDIKARAMAGMYGTTTDEIRKMHATDPEAFTRSSFTLVNMATEIKALAAKVATPDGSETDAAKLRILMEDFVTATMHHKKMQTETARTLSAMRISKHATANAAAQVAEIVEQYGGMGMQKRIAAMVDSLDLQDAGDMAVFGKFVQKSHRARSGQMLWEIWMQALLSSPQTHAVNFGSSFGAYALRTPELFGAYGIGLARKALTGSDEGLYMRELLAFVADADTIKHATKRAWTAAKTGEPSDLTTKFDPAVHRRAVTAANVRGNMEASVATKWLTTVAPNFFKDGHWTQKGFDFLADYGLRLPSRVMVTADEFNKGLMYQSMMKMQASHKAIEEGLGGKALADRMAELLSNPELLMPGAQKAAHDAALDITFQKPLEGAGRAWQKFVFSESAVDTAIGRTIAGAAKTVALRMNMPFVKTPINLAKYTVERTPGAVMLPSFWSEIGAGGARADLAMSKMAIGTAMTYGLWELAASGYITGGGPVDKKLQSQWKSLGFQPYSHPTAGGGNISYKRFDPFSMMAGIVADYQDVARYASPDEKNLITAGIVASMYRNMNDRTFMSNFASLMKATEEMANGDAGALQRHYARLASTVVPAGVAWLGRQIDERERTFKSTKSEALAIAGGEKGPTEPMDDAFLEGIAMLELAINKIKARSPGLGEDLPDFLDFWGDEVKGPVGLFFDVLPFGQKRMKFKPSDAEEFGLHPTRWTGTPVDVIGEGRWLRYLHKMGVEGEFIRLGWAPGPHSQRIMGVPLTPTEYHGYVKAVNSIVPEEDDGIWVFGEGVAKPGEELIIDITGHNLRDALTELMVSDAYYNAPDTQEMLGSKPRMVSALISFYRHRIGYDRTIGAGGADLIAFEDFTNLGQRLQRARSILTPDARFETQGGILR